MPWEVPWWPRVRCAVFSLCSSVGVGMGVILNDAVDLENSLPIGIIQALIHLNCGNYNERTEYDDDKYDHASS